MEDTPFLRALAVCRRHGQAAGPAAGFAAAAAAAACGAKRCFEAEGARASPRFMAELRDGAAGDVWATPAGVAVAARGNQIAVQTLLGAAGASEAAEGLRAPEANHLLGAAYGYVSPGASPLFGPTVVWVAGHGGAEGVMWYEALGLCLDPEGREVALRRLALAAAAPAAVRPVVVMGVAALQAELAKYGGAPA